MSDTQSRLTFTNTGTAPIYYDAYPEINGIRSTESLKGLSPGETRIFTIPISTDSPNVRIYSPHILSGQEIQFAANTISTGISSLSGFSVQLIHNQLEMSADCDVHLFDIHGKPAGTWHNVRSADISAYPTGFYIAVVSCKGETLRLKIIRK